MGILSLSKYTTQVAHKGELRLRAMSRRGKRSAVNVEKTSTTMKKNKVCKGEEIIAPLTKIFAEADQLSLVKSGWSMSDALRHLSDCDSDLKALIETSSIPDRLTCESSRPNKDDPFSALLKSIISQQTNCSICSCCDIRKVLYGNGHSTTCNYITRSSDQC